MIYLPLAIEIANDRMREAIRAADADRLRMLATPPGPRRPNSVRRSVASAVRAIGDASHAVSEAACSVATRIEGTAS